MMYGHLHVRVAQQQIKALCSMPRPTSARDAASRDICAELKRKRMALQQTHSYLYDQRRGLKQEKDRVDRQLKDVNARLLEARKRGDAEAVKQLQKEKKDMLSKQHTLEVQLREVGDSMQKLDRAIKEVTAQEQRNGCNRFTGGCMSFAAAGNDFEEYELDWYDWIYNKPEHEEHDTIQNPIHLIGGSHGGDMTSLVYNGHLVTKLEGWAEGGNGIIGLRVTYSNGQVKMFGRQGGDVMEINLHKRIVSKAHLYGNGCGTRLGKIELFFPGFEKSETISMPNHKAQQYSIVTGSGLLAGVVVRHGHDIDALALVFLRPLASVDGYMDYGKPTVISSQLNAIDGLEYKNDSNSTQKFPKGKEVSTKRSTSLEHRWGAKLEMEYEYNAKWTAGVPAVDQAEITSKFNLRLTLDYGGTHIKNESQEETYRWSWDIEVMPGEHFDQVLYIENNTSSIPFSAQLVLTTDRGGKWTLNHSGVTSLTNMTKHVILPGRNHRPNPGREGYEGQVNAKRNA